MKQQRLSICMAAAVLAAAAAPCAHAIDLEAGDWKFTVTGNVNGSYIYSNCDSSPHIVAGGLACIAPTGSSSVSNGLLPAAIAFNGSTHQAGYDLAFTFGFYPGISANDGGSPNLLQTLPNSSNVALATTGIDMRQVFLTFGNDVMGTVLVGRNIGLFASDAILNDMTLQAVGGGSTNYAAPVNTALGSIGVGYIYADWLAQIDYSTPEYLGFKATVGVFDPLETLASNQNTPATKNMPGFQGKMSYKFEQLYLSAAGLFQKQRGIDVPDANLLEGRGYSSWAFDVGGKYDFGPVEVVGWYYNGAGVGTTGLFIRANDPVTGRPRNSDGFLAQITCQLGPTKLGFNYGQSRLGHAQNETTGALVEKNDKYTLGIYHSLTENLLLTAEANYVESFNHARQLNASRSFDVGAFLKF
jgi:predicted porin